MASNLKIHHLRDFVAIAQHESVRGAARALGQAQPAVSRSLRELERELGTPLVNRHARGIVLTETGQRFLVRARAAMEEIRRGTEEAQHSLGITKGNVAVGLSSAAMLGLLPSAVRSFRKKHPEVRLRIAEGVFPTLESRLRDGTLDFYIGPPPASLPREYQSELYFHNERAVVARKRHPFSEVRSLRELTGATWIMTGLRQREEEEFEELFNAYELPAPTDLIRAESILAVLTLLASTDSLALLPRQWTDSQLFKGVVEPVKVREKLLAPDIVMIRRAAVPLTPMAEAFANLLLRAAST